MMYSNNYNKVTRQHNIGEAKEDCNSNWPSNRGPSPVVLIDYFCRTN